jgi:hypothetical protein
MSGHVVPRRFRWAFGLLTVVSCVAGCGDEPRLGHVTVSAAVVDDSRCPAIHALAAEPGQAFVGSQIALRVIATPAKSNDALVYSWSPAAGIAEAASPNASYTCLTPGVVTVNVKVTEKVGAGSCSVEESLPVTCL